MWFVAALVVLALMGYGMWRFAEHARDVDEDIKYMNEGRGTGLGIFGIFRRDRS
ncbi:MAG: hypothetical protein ACR2N4_08710 [Jatrophihabitans sp.]